AVQAEVAGLSHPGCCHSVSAYHLQWGSEATGYTEWPAPWGGTSTGGQDHPPGTARRPHPGGGGNAADAPHESGVVHTSVRALGDPESAPARTGDNRCPDECTPASHPIRHRHTRCPAGAPLRCGELWCHHGVPA